MEMVDYGKLSLRKFFLDENNNNMIKARDELVKTMYDFFDNIEKQDDNACMKDIEKMVKAIKTIDELREDNYNQCCGLIRREANRDAAICIASENNKQVEKELRRAARIVN